MTTMSRRRTDRFEMRLDTSRGMFSLFFVCFLRILLTITVAHKTVPMFSHFGEMDLVWSDDISQGPEIFRERNITSYLSNRP